MANISAERRREQGRRSARHRWEPMIDPEDRSAATRQGRTALRRKFEAMADPDEKFEPELRGRMGGILYRAFLSILAQQRELNKRKQLQMRAAWDARAEALAVRETSVTLREGAVLAREAALVERLSGLAA